MRHIQLERRSDLHREHLIDVGVGLRKAHGAELARDYLEEVKVPEPIILRVLARAQLREQAPDEDAAELCAPWLTPR